MNRILNCVPSQDVETDWPLDVAIRAGFIQAIRQPASVDLREPWWDIGDQGETGSCVGWATADGLMRWLMYKAGRIVEEHLSPRYVWMAAKETDEFRSRATSFLEQEGTSIKAALDITRKYGVVTDSDLPFVNGVMSQLDTNIFYAKAAMLRITAYFNLGLTQSKWKTWLATKGPILCCIDVGDSWMNISETGVLDAYDHASLGGHAVVLVGYTPTGFIVRNSWGAGWGDKGFAYMTDAYARGVVREAYGATV